MASNEQTIGNMFGSPETGTFLGLPSCPDLSALDADIAILGAGCATPYRSVGAYCAQAPAAIRAAMAHYAATMSHYDFDLRGPLLATGPAKAVDCGDLPFDEADAPGNRERIRSAVSRILDRGATPIVIGGDDSVPIPLFQAFEGRGRFTILQLDAHIDFREEVDGERWGLSSTMRRASELPCIERIIQVGQRGVGSARPADYEAALARGVSFVPASALAANGIGQVLELVPRGANVLIAFDCDALDPSIMPAVIGRAPGGLTYWQAIGLIEGVAERGRIAAFDLVEFMPARDVDGLGALLAGRIVAHVIGLVARNRVGNTR
jgi:agmatinase